MKISKKTKAATLKGTAMRTVADSHFLLAKWIPVNAAEDMIETRNRLQNGNSKLYAVLSIKVTPHVKSMEMTTAITALMPLGYWFSSTTLNSLVRI